MADDDKQTDRVVLKRERVLVLPGDATDEQIKNAQRELRPSKAPPEAGLLVEAWREVGNAGGSKSKAVEHFAGKPGTTDAKAGRYKAPSSRSWRGTVVYDLPAEPVAQRSLLED